MRASRILLFFSGFILLASTPAMAAGLNTYVTYGGFASIYPAFQQCAAIFNSSDYSGMVTALSLLGIMVTAMINVVSKAERATPMAWVFMAMAGILVYLGLFVPKDNLEIYDPVYNQDQVVAGLPIAVVMTAQISNLIEQFAVTILDSTAAGTTTACGTLPPMQYQTSGGSVAPALLAATANSTVQNATESQYLMNYMNVCWTFEIGRPGTSTTSDMLLSPGCGFTMLDVLGLAQNPAVFVTNPQNQSVSCTQAYTDLQTFYSTPANAGAAALNACGGSDFTDMAQCQSLIQSITQSTLGLNLDANSLILQQTLANVATMALVSGDASSIQQMAQIQQSSATSGVLASVSNPQLINTYMACVIIMIPFIAMLLVTGSMWQKAFSLIIALIFFITIVRVLDVICFHLWASHYQSAMASAYNNDGLGSAVSLTLNAKISGMLNTLGYLRSSIVGIATVVSSVLFHFSDQGMARMGVSMEAKSEGLDHEFKDPGNASIKEQKEAGAREAMVSAIASGQHGMQNYSVAETGRIMGEAANATGAMGAAGGATAFAAGTSQISGQKYSHDAAKAGQIDNSISAADGTREGQATRGTVAERTAAIETMQQHGVSQEGIDKTLAAFPDAGGLAATVEQANRQSPGLKGDAFSEKMLEGRTLAAAGNLQEQVQDTNMVWNKTQTVGPDGSRNEIYQSGDTRLTASTNGKGESAVTSISGGNSGLTSNNGWRDSYQEASREADNETTSRSQDLTKSISTGLRKAETRGKTWDELSSYSKSDGSSTAFRNEYSQIGNDILRNATSVTDSHGKDRTSELHSGINAGVSLGVPTAITAATGVGGSVGGSGGMTYRVTTKDGTTYTATLDKAHTDEIHKTMAKSTADEYRRTHEDRTSVGNHKGLQRVVEASESTQAAEHVAQSISHSQSLEKARTSMVEQGAGSDVKLNVPFYNNLADSMYGDHSVDHVRGAVGYVEKMARDGNGAQVAKLQKDFLTSGKHLPEDNAGALPTVGGPSSQVDTGAVNKEIDAGKAAIELKQDAIQTPTGANEGRVERAMQQKGSTGLSDPTAPGGPISEAQHDIDRTGANLGKAYGVSKSSAKDLGGLFGTKGAPIPSVAQVKNGEVSDNSPTLLHSVGNGISEAASSFAQGAFPIASGIPIDGAQVVSETVRGDMGLADSPKNSGHSSVEEKLPVPSTDTTSAGHKPAGSADNDDTAPLRMDQVHALSAGLEPGPPVSPPQLHQEKILDPIRPVEAQPLHQPISSSPAPVGTGSAITLGTAVGSQSSGRQVAAMVAEAVTAGPVAPLQLHQEQILEPSRPIEEQSLQPLGSSSPVASVGAGMSSTIGAAVTKPQPKHTPDIQSLGIVTKNPPVTPSSSGSRQLPTSGDNIAVKPTTSGGEKPRPDQ